MTDYSDNPKWSLGKRNSAQNRHFCGFRNFETKRKMRSGYFKMGLSIKPISIREANEYVERMHRHHGKKTGCRFAIGCYEGGVLHGVAICSNPVARNADDGLTLEVSRVCTDGTRNACSILYGACARIAKEMGFRKVQTYILESESGTSLKASGWKCEGKTGSVSWMHNPSERTKMRNAQLELFPTKKIVPEEMKVRWAKTF